MTPIFPLPNTAATQHTFVFLPPCVVRKKCQEALTENSDGVNLCYPTLCRCGEAEARSGYDGFPSSPALGSQPDWEFSLTLSD